MKAVSILGSTGSIGVSTLDVIARHPDRYKVIALTANKNVSAMLAQCETFKPRFAVMVDADAATQLKKGLATVSTEIEVLSGVEGLERVAALAEVDYVMAAIVGAAGLLPTLAAARAVPGVVL